MRFYREQMGAVLAATCMNAAIIEKTFFIGIPLQIPDKNKGNYSRLGGYGRLRMTLLRIARSRCSGFAPHSRKQAICHHAVMRCCCQKDVIYQGMIWVA